MTWCLPLPMQFAATGDGESFRVMAPDCTGIPLPPHPGSFGFVRKNHVHEGLDFYCPDGTPVNTMQRERVVAIVPFTGASTESPWWHETKAILTENDLGVWVYGEVIPKNGLTIGTWVEAGKEIGRVRQVLKKDKGRPMSMLHLELHVPNTRTVAEWPLPPPGRDKFTTKPPTLLDPTPYILKAFLG